MVAITYECEKIIMPKSKKKNLSNATIFDEGGYHVQGHLAVADACRTPDCTGFLTFILSKKTLLIIVCSYSLYQSMVIILVEGWGSKSNAFAPSALFFFVKYLYAALPSWQVTAADRWPSQCPLQGTQSSTGGN